MKNKLIILAVQRGTTVDAMMESLLAQDMSVGAMCNVLGVSPGTVHNWLRKNGYYAEQVTTIRWRKRQ